MQIIKESPIKLKTKIKVLLKASSKKQTWRNFNRCNNALRQHVGYYQVPNKSKNHLTPWNVAQTNQLSSSSVWVAPFLDFLLECGDFPWTG